MAKKIYLVQFEEVENLEKICEKVEAFEKEKDAQTYFQSVVESLKEDYENKLEDWEVDESNNEFCAYPDGEYLDFHLLLTLKELNLN